ncbi:MAG: cytochrome c3 family protein [bacterium]
MANRIVSLVAGIGFSLLILGGGLYWWSSQSSPTRFSTSSGQPIAFSHRIHAGKLNLSCASCHTGVTEGPVARLPSVKRCADCHMAQKGWEEIEPVDPRQASEMKQKVNGGKTEELGKLKWYWTERKPIPWRKVHDLPDHVQFEHKRHVRAGVSCATCHGNVSTMKTARKVKELDMAFCVSCHMSSKVANFRSEKGTENRVMDPDTSTRRLRDGLPATWKKSNPHKDEFNELAKKFGYEIKQVRFDCATCHM